MARRGVRLQGMSGISKRLQEAISSRSVQEWADEHKLPYWVVRDTLYGRVACPSSRYVTGMARGMGISTDELLALAHAKDGTGRTKGEAKASERTSANIS